MEQTYEWIRLAQAGDAAAKNSLLQENSGLIWSVVGRFRGRGEPEDLYQIGAIGLLKCIEKFDFSYDVKFSTYAVPMILGEIKRFLRDDGTVKVSRSLKELAWRAKRLQEAVMQEESRELSLQELAERLEVEKEFAGAGYGTFKTAVGEAVVAELEPVQKRVKELEANKDYLDAIIKSGAEKASRLADRTLTKVQKKVGFPPRIR